MINLIIFYSMSRSNGWGFYGRRDELGRLLEILRAGRWFFVAVRGRRRIGKTALVQQALTVLEQDERQGRAVLFFQLPDSDPADAVAVFRMAVRNAGLQDFVQDLDGVRDLPGMAAGIGSLCAAGTVVAIDEFQVCHRGPIRAFPSLLQAHVDRLQAGARGAGSRGGLVVLGSVQTEMEALIEDRRAPLFGRTTSSLTLGPWDIRTVFEVCEEHGASEPMRCLTLWTLFGGVPKYWRHFAETDGLDALPGWEDWAAEVCGRLFLRSDAPLRDEGDAFLGRELHRGNLAILRVLAQRRVCSHAELRQSLSTDSGLGQYMKTLVQDLRLVEKELPVFASERSRGARYLVADPFLRAWLSVLQPACQSARIAPLPVVTSRLLPQLRTLEGIAFERLVREASEEASRAGGCDFPITDRVRGYWNRPRGRGEPIEIDLVAWNEGERRVRFGSCKRDAARHDRKSLRAFREHVERFLSDRVGRRFRTWTQEFVLFAPAFPPTRRREREEGGWLCRDLDDFRGMLGNEALGSKGAWTVSEKIRGEA